MKPVLSSDSSHEELVGQAAGEFFDALSRGAQPSIDEFAERYPAIAEHIRRTFPALLVVGDMSTDETSDDIFVCSISERTLGDFRIVRELGRGGMGTVFEAEQISMGRRVALKVLPFAALVHDKSLQRFRNEVRAAAALDDPHIVSIYSVGEERGVHFFAMQLIRGQTMADAIAQLRDTERAKSQTADSSIDHKLLSMGGGSVDKSTRKSTPTQHSANAPSRTMRGQRATITTTGASREIWEFYRAAARLGIQAAEALQHAHDQGVLHRDIKPSNLMLDAEGQLYITDFGLARIEADAGLTMTGDVIGTLRYMAPEQALAKRVIIDHRADIYSLGATLYELLTLQPAFSETDRSELLKQIAFEDPRPLRKVDHRIPTELETIVLKSMAKIPDERYETSQQLADDLRAFIEDRPITARPATFADRVRKWSRRHQTLVRAAGAAFVLFTGLLVISMALVKHAQTQALAALKETSDLLYTSDMTIAYETFEKGWPDEVRKILDRHRPTGSEPDRRGLEWYLLHKLVQQPTSLTLAGHKGHVNELAVFPDRRRLASVGEDGRVRIWDTHSSELRQTIPISDQALHSVAVSPDGRFVAAGNTDLYLCDLKQESLVTRLVHSETNIESLVFSNDGKHLAAGARYNEVIQLSLDGEVEKRIPCASRVQSLEYVAGSSQLLVPNRRAVAGQQPMGMVQIWRDGLTSLQRELDGSVAAETAQNAFARSSPCGRFVAAGEVYRSKVRLFDLASGRVLAETPAARDSLTDLAYSPDGKAVAVSYGNGNVEYCELQRGADGSPVIDRRLSVISAHRGRVESIRFVDAKRLASCGTDGLIKIWNASNDSTQAIDLTDSRLSTLKLSPDGARLFYFSHDEFFILDMDRGEVVYRRRHRDEYCGEPAWSPRGDKAAIGRVDPVSVVILDPSGGLLHSIPNEALPEAMAFSPDGALIAIVSSQQLRICKCENGQDIIRERLSHPVKNVAYSHDGRWLACGGQFDAVCVYDLKKRQFVRELASGHHANCLVFSPDDSVLASGHVGSVIRLWNLQTGVLQAELVGHERATFDLAFSADGRTLLSSAADGTIRVWSVGSGRGYGVVYRRFEPGTQDAWCRMGLSSDGRRLVAGYETQKNDCPDVLSWRLDPIVADSIPTE